MTIIAPDLLLAQEFLSTDHQRLQRLGLTVRSLSGVQLAAVIALGQQQPRVSVNDLTAYVLARDLDAVLLTGDGALRSLAKQTGVACHGTLWLLDEIVRLGIASPNAMSIALRSILANGGRLPAADIRERLHRWRTS